MAEKEMYDYLPTITPDYTTTTLSVTPHSELPFVGKKTQIVHELMGATAPVVINVSSDSYFDVQIEWNILSASDAGTVMDFYHDPLKANGMERSFYWAHPVDGHTYVAKFTSDFSGKYVSGWGTNQKLSGFSMRIFGRKAD